MAQLVAERAKKAGVENVTTEMAVASARPEATVEWECGGSPTEKRMISPAAETSRRMKPESAPSQARDEGVVAWERAMPEMPGDG